MPQTFINGVRLVTHPSPANVRRIDLGCLPIVSMMHRNGILIDVPHLNRVTSELDVEMLSIWESIKKAHPAAGDRFNVNSPKQVGELIYDDLGLLPPSGVVARTKSGGRSTDDEALSDMRTLNPIVDLILDGREVLKVKGTYTAKLPRLVNPDTSRLHTTFSPTTARTGRFTSENPNLQNIPTRGKWGKKVRNGFMARRGCKLVSFDLSQIEMVLAAHCSQDPAMMDVFNRGLDIHTMTTCIVFDEPYEFWQSLITRADLPSDHMDYPEPWELIILGEFKKQKRLPCKTVGFGVLYGQTASGMQSSVLAQGGPLLDIPTCDGFIEGFFDAYSFLRILISYWHRMARTTNMVWDIWGRWRIIPEVRSPFEWVISSALRQAGNTPIQSGAGGVLKLCMAAFLPVVQRFQSYASEVCAPLLTIHDELIFEVSGNIADEFVALGKLIMTNTVILDTVPIRSSSDVAERWGDLK